MLIDCDDCVMDGTSACDDCVVSFIVGPRRCDVVEIDAAEERDLRLLQGEGLVPGLRLVRRSA